MKKTLSRLVLLCLLCALSLPALAADSEPEFRFALSANGKTVVEAECGDIITVNLVLERTDADEPFTMYGVQDELRYDGSFLELIESSVLCYPGIVTTDISVQGAFRELYMNYVSLSGGESWQSRTTVGSVQFRVLGTKGISRISNRDALVSGGQCSWQDVSIAIAGDCIVRFETNGGHAINDMTVRCGHLIPEPDTPTRRGYSFGGWYRDEGFNEPWDFENDLVESDMTLYARWSENSTAFSAWWLLLLLLPVAIVILRKRRRSGT